MKRRKGIFRLWLVALGLAMLVAGNAALDSYLVGSAVSDRWTVTLVEAALESEHGTFADDVGATPSQVLASFSDLHDVELREMLRTKLPPATVESIDEKHVNMLNDFWPVRAAMLLKYLSVTLAAFIAVWILGEIGAWVMRGLSADR